MFSPVAEQFPDAIERADFGALRKMLHPDVAIWHNTDRNIVDRDACLAAFTSFCSRTDMRAYKDRRFITTESGYVFQFTLMATKSGHEFEMPGCMICTLSGGRIAGIDEYIDPAPLRAWLTSVAATAMD